jgi:hypothetical protein
VQASDARAPYDARRRTKVAIGRQIMGTVAGVAAAAVTVAAIETVGHTAFRSDAVFATAIAGYGLGALIGTTAASLIAGHHVAIAVPLILAVLATINLLSFTHPAWFAPAAAVALGLGWLAGSRLTSGRRLASSETLHR